MSVVAFIGDPLHLGTDPDEVRLGGFVFPLGAIVEVDAREHVELIAKLSGNSHFVVFDQSMETMRGLWIDGLGPPGLDSV